MNIKKNKKEENINKEKNITFDDIFKLLSYEKEYCCRKLENEHYSC